MSRIVKLTCNCGCGAETDNSRNSGWFELSQLFLGVSVEGPKLRESVYFSSLECLEKKWAHRAVLVSQGLREEMRGLSPQGEFTDDKIPELYI